MTCDSNRQSMKNVLWNTFGSIFYSFCQWLITIIVVYVASYKEAGYLSLAMTTSSSLSAISLFSMRNYQVSDVNEEYSRHEYIGSRVFTCMLSLIICLMVSWIGHSFYMALCIDMFMLIRIAEAFADVLHGQDQRYDRYDYIGISYILRGLATVLVFAGMLRFTGDILQTLIVVAIVNLLAVFVWDLIRTNGLSKIKPIIYNDKIKSLLSHCIPLVVFSFLLSVENLVAKTALEKLMGTEQLGIYSTIATPTLVVQVFAMVAFNPFLPKFSYDYQNGLVDSFKKNIYKLSIAFAGLYVITLTGAFLLGRIILSIIFMPDILEYYELFMPIILVTLLTGTIWVLSAVLIGMRDISFLLKAIVVDFVICLICVIPCIKIWGMNGASIAQIIPQLILVAVLLIRIFMLMSRMKVCKTSQ